MRLQNPCVREGFGMELLGWEPVCLLRTSQITHWANEATLMKKKKKDKGAGLGLEGPRPQRREDMRLIPEDREGPGRPIIARTACAKVLRQLHNGGGGRDQKGHMEE